ncbi:prolyl-tRNA synthetase [Aeromonas hydrophila ML09-119]|nr:prolyl-tRNA synthetase [Aeromonas hydrophila ML09-119]
MQVIGSTWKWEYCTFIQCFAAIGTPSRHGHARLRVAPQTGKLGQSGSFMRHAIHPTLHSSPDIRRSCGTLLSAGSAGHSLSAHRSRPRLHLRGGQPAAAQAARSQDQEPLFARPEERATVSGGDAGREPGRSQGTGCRPWRQAAELWLARAAGIRAWPHPGCGHPARHGARQGKSGGTGGGRNDLAGRAGAVPPAGQYRHPAYPPRRRAPPASPPRPGGHRHAAAGRERLTSA